MRRLALMSVLLSSTSAALTILALGVAQGCGPSQLSKDYADYDAKAEKLLARETPVWSKLWAEYVAQAQAEMPELSGLRSMLSGESVPFYDAIKGDVAAAAPSQKEFGPAHEALTKYAEKHARFARALSDGFDVMRGSERWQEIQNSEARFDAAKADYMELVRGRVAPPDQRFLLIQNAERDFQRLCVVPMSEGRVTATQAATIVKSQIQPKIREARAATVADDEEGRAVTAALVAADEFFDCMQKMASLMEESARLGYELATLQEEADEHFTKFKDEMKAVRGRM